MEPLNPLPEPKSKSSNIANRTKPYSNPSPTSSGVVKRWPQMPCLPVVPRWEPVSRIRQFVSILYLKPRLKTNIYDFNYSFPFSRNTRSYPSSGKTRRTFTRFASQLQWRWPRVRRWWRGIRWRVRGQQPQHEGQCSWSYRTCSRIEKGGQARVYSPHHTKA